MMKKWIVSIAVSVFCLLGYLQEGQAQFIGFSIDGAIAYSGAPGNIQGGSVGITHPAPFIPNLGAMVLSFDDNVDNNSKENQLNDQLSLDTQVSMRSIELYYHVEFPVVSLVLGVGAGLMDTQTEVVSAGAGSLETINLTNPFGEAFARVGLILATFFEFHIGYHLLSIPTIDRVEGGDTDLSAFETEKNYSGGMTTIGILFAF